MFPSSAPSIAFLTVPRIPVILALGDAAIRQALVERLRPNWGILIHPDATIDPTAEIGPGTVIFAGVLVEPSVVIGYDVILNANATVCSDCILDDYVLSGPASMWPEVCTSAQARLSESCRIDAECAGGRMVRRRSGAAVTSDLPDRVVAVGCPAKVIKERKQGCAGRRLQLLTTRTGPRHADDCRYWPVAE